MTSACQNAVRAAQSALLANAYHVVISCPENPCSVLFIYSGEFWGHTDGILLEHLLSLLHLCVFCFVYIDAPNVFICDNYQVYFGSLLQQEEN